MGDRIEFESFFHKLSPSPGASPGMDRGLAAAERWPDEDPTVSGVIVGLARPRGGVQDFLVKPSDQRVLDYLKDVGI